MWDITLQRNKEITLSRQLFYAVKGLIVEGRIAAGEALPSSRRLALDLSVSTKYGLRGIRYAYDGRVYCQPTGRAYAGEGRAASGSGGRAVRLRRRPNARHGSLTWILRPDSRM